MWGAKTATAFHKQLWYSAAQGKCSWSRNPFQGNLISCSDWDLKPHHPSSRDTRPCQVFEKAWRYCDVVGFSQFVESESTAATFEDFRGACAFKMPVCVQEGRRGISGTEFCIHFVLLHVPTILLGIPSRQKYTRKLTRRWKVKHQSNPLTNFTLKQKYLVLKKRKSFQFKWTVDVALN